MSTKRQLVKPQNRPVKGKGKGFPYSVPSVGPGADPGVLGSQPAGDRYVIHPAVGCHYFPPWPAVTSPVTEHHRPLAGTKLYCLVTEVHRCEQLARGCFAVGPEPVTY